MRHRQLRSLFLVLVLATAMGTAASLLVRAPGTRGDFWRWELATYDVRLRMRAQRPASPRVVIVGIDTASLVREKCGWPWPRTKHAKLIERLSSAGAGAILLDILFDFPSTPVADRALIGAVRRSGRTVLTAVAETDSDTGAAAGAPPRLLTPFPALAAAARGTGLGMLPKDTDGTVRRVRLGWDPVRPQERPLLFSGLLALAVADRVPPARLADQWRAHSFRTHPWVTDADLIADLLIDYRAAPPAAFPYVSYSDVLRGDFEPDTFRNKIVLVGMKSGLNPDMVLHPLGSQHSGTESGDATLERSEMPGVEAIGNVVDMLLERRTITPAAMGLATLLPVIYGALVALCVFLLPFWAGGLATAALLVLHWTVASYGMIVHGAWLPVASVGVATLAAYTTAATTLWFLEERALRLLRQTWQRRVSRQILDQILSRPELHNVPGRRVDATVVFMDLANFTSMSTRIGAEQLIGYLNEYLSLATEVTQAHGGVVHKFIGDGVMIAYGDPVDIGNHAQKAVDAAYDFQRQMAQLRERIAGQGGPELRARIGIHSGEVVAGDIGAEALLEYTIVGKSVNLASRLEGLNKKLASTICVSAPAYQRLQDTHSLHYAGQHEVAGYPDPVDVYTDTAAQQTDRQVPGGAPA